MFNFYKKNSMLKTVRIFNFYKHFFRVKILIIYQTIMF